MTIPVSIQPKPKKGLVAIEKEFVDTKPPCFNPAEAEEGFSSYISNKRIIIISRVSIQPKPKKGLVAVIFIVLLGAISMVSIQPKPKKGLVVRLEINRCNSNARVSIQPKPKKGLVV